MKFRYAEPRSTRPRNSERYRVLPLGLYFPRSVLASPTIGGLNRRPPSPPAELAAHLSCSLFAIRRRFRGAARSLIGVSYLS